MNNFQRVLRNTSYLFISEIFIKIIGFLWIVYLARSVSVDAFGRYNLVNSFIAVFSFLPDMGVGLIIIREIAKHKDNAAKYIAASFFLNAFLSLITVIGVICFAYILGYQLPLIYLLLIASITLFASTIRSVSVFYFDGMEKMKYSAILNSLNSLFLIVGGFLGLWFGFGVLGIFVGMFFGTILSTVISWKTLLSFISPVFLFNHKHLKEILLEGVPLGIASFSALIYTKVDAIILNQMLGETAVGIYSSATPFVIGLIQLLNVPFVVAVYPALSRLSKIDGSRFKNATVKSLSVISVWSFLAAIVVSLFAFLLPTLFGERYTAAVPILRFLIFFVPFASLSALLYKVLIILKKQHLYLAISIFGALLNIIGNIMLIPAFNIFGAAIASVGTQIILFMSYGFVVYYYMRKI